MLALLSFLLPYLWHRVYRQRALAAAAVAQSEYDLRLHRSLVALASLSERAAMAEPVSRTEAKGDLTRLTVNSAADLLGSSCVGVCFYGLDMPAIPPGRELTLRAASARSEDRLLRPRKLVEGGTVGQIVFEAIDNRTTLHKESSWPMGLPVWDSTGRDCQSILVAAVSGAKKDLGVLIACSDVMGCWDGDHANILRLAAAQLANGLTVA